MNKAQVLLMVSIVFVAGCIGQGTAGVGGPGCVVTGPVINPSTAEPGTSILVDLTVKNEGGAECRNVRAELFGFPSGNIHIQLGNNPQSLGSLLPADPTRGVSEGQEATAEWTISGEGRTVDVPYDIGARVTYDYTTTLEGTIKAVTPEYLRRTNDKGGIDFKSTTGGPISLSLVAPSTVISGGRTIYNILITNNGAGTVENERITVSVAGCGSKEVTLRKGATQRITCPLDAAAVRDFQVYSVTASTSYTYSIEKVSTVTILKQAVIGGIINI